MKITLLMTIFLTIANTGFAKASSSKTKNSNVTSHFSKVVTVHGMVCAFCSNSLEKKFKKEKAVENISVDLDKKIVSVLFKKGHKIKDERLDKIITSSGFSVVDIKDYTAK